MKKEIQKKLSSLFAEFSINDFTVADYYLDNAWRDKLFESLDNGQYKFKYPIKLYDDIEYLKLNHRMREIVALKGEKIMSGDKYYCYDFKVVLDDGTETDFYLSNRIVLHHICDAIYADEMLKEKIKPSDVLEFENEDIIITDPCYIMKDNTNDWERCEYGKNMEVLGLHKFVVKDTIYGDWSCTTYDADSKEPIGKFCADAGLVGVFSLDEVRSYNPDIDRWIETNDWCVTKISNFTGKVYIDVKYTEGVYDEDKVSNYPDGTTTTWARKGDKYENYEVKVIGNGNVKFSTAQTGLL